MKSRKLCVACKRTKTRKFLTKTSRKPANWLRDLERSAVPTHSFRYKDLYNQSLPDYSPTRSDICVKITRRDLPRRVLFWAANSTNVISGAEKAYGNYENMGITTQSRDTLTFYIRTPSPYISQQKLWCRHLHFCDLDEMKTIYTLVIMPCTRPLKFDGGLYTCMPLSFEEPSMYMNFDRYIASKKKGAIGISAVSEKIFDDDIIITPRDKIKRIDVKTHLVVYCANYKCNAAENLIQYLYSIGYCNISYFKGGIEEAAEVMSRFTREMYIKSY